MTKTVEEKGIKYVFTYPDNDDNFRQTLKEIFMSHIKNDIKTKTV